MAIFTAIATALFAGTVFAGTFVVTAVASLLSIGASLGLSYLQKSLAGDPAAETFAIQGKLQAGGTVPRSFNVGYSVTAGSLVYANTWGNSGETPNAFFTQVIALSDLPGGDLLEVWVNGELCALGPTGIDDNLGRPVVGYEKDGLNHLWVKYYDGTQTTADYLCVNMASSAERPYEATRVGTGIAYVVVTAIVEEKLFTGFPSFKFATSGISLYDPSKDSTVPGGSGLHRYDDPATWGGDGDQLPAVQIYNLLRGIKINGAWLYGIQGLGAARLPAANWIPQIAKCRATITGVGGLEPAYRSGGQIAVNAELGSTIEAILSSCQGRLSEIGGFYKIHVGAPDSPTFAWTDDDILSTEDQTFRPFFALADSINGVQATYPDPAQGWNMATAPAYERTDLEVKDGNRKLWAAPALTFVPYPAQVQRLQKSAVEEAQRARTHVISLPPSFWIVEPGDVGQWTSGRNGYATKSFRVDGAVDQPNLDITLSVTEVDPADYDWNHVAEYRPANIGSTVLPRPSPQGVLDWYAEPWTIDDDNGQRRRPAIRLSWDGTLPGIVGVSFKIRKSSDQVEVYKGQVPEMVFAEGAVIISQNLLPNTAYQAQGQYIPSAPRDMLPSAWLDVTTPNVLADLVDLNDALTYQVTSALDQLHAAQDLINQKIAALGSINAARNWLDKQQAREELASVSGQANARITEVSTVATNLEASLAQTELELIASIGAADARITQTNTALSDLTSSTTSSITTLNSNFGSVSASLSSEITTRANADSAISAQLTNYIAQTNNSFASVNSQIIAATDANSATAASLNTYKAQTDANIASANNSIITLTNNDSALAGSISSLTTTVNNNTAAISNESVARSDADSAISANVSSLTTTVNGNTASINSVTASVNGMAVKYGVFGTINGVTGGFQLQGAIRNDGSVSYGFEIYGDLVVTGSITSRTMADNAVTVTNAYTATNTINANAAYQNVGAVTVNVDTAGLAGKTLSLLVTSVVQVGYNQQPTDVRLYIDVNGSQLYNVVAVNYAPSIAMSGLYTFTADGSVMTFTANLNYFGSLNTAGTGPGSNVLQRTLTLVGAKR